MTKNYRYPLSEFGELVEANNATKISDDKDAWYIWNKISGSGCWYVWETNEHFDELCKFPNWRKSMRERLWLGNEKRIRRDVDITPEQLERLGFHKEIVDQYTYDTAVREFKQQYEIPFAEVELTKFEKSLFAWGLEMGLPL